MTKTRMIEIDPKQMVIDWVSSTAFTPVNKVAMRKLGHKSAILLSETINQYKRWKMEGKLQEDMFFWTEEHCEIETALNKSSQNREFKKLEEKQLLKRFTKKINGNKTCRFIKLNFDEIVTVLFEDVEKTKDDIRNKYAERRKQNKRHKEKYVLKRKLQNETSGKLQNETSGKLQNGTQIKNKNHNKNKDINKNISKKNLSIIERLENIDLPPKITKILEKQIDRLNSDYIPDIELKFNSYKESISVEKFADILNTVLNQEIKSNFTNYLDRSLNTYIDNRAKSIAENNTNKPVRTEKLPEGFNNWSQPDNSQSMSIDYFSMSLDELYKAKETFESIGQPLPKELKEVLNEKNPSWG